MRRLLRGALYAAGFVTWALAIGGVGRLAAWILQDIRERDRAATRLVYDVETGETHTALLLSPPLRWPADFIHKRPETVDNPDAPDAPAPTS